MSFININNKQTNPTATYSATVIREALLSVETKNTAKVDTLVKSIDRDLTLSEALEFFTAKLSAMNALNIALINEAAQKKQTALEAKHTFTTAVDVIKLNESMMADIDILAQEAKDLADFTKTFFKEFGGKIKKTADSIEWVEELYASSITEALAINERSITKIQKEYGEVVKDMTKTVTDWKAAEGDVKTQLLEKLRALTARKKELEAELDSAVMGKDRNVELSGAFESVVTEAKAVKVTKKEWPYVEFKDGGKTHKVEFDYEDIIDDHGNEGQDQYWLGKDDNGQEWMIDVYASSRGDVEEVHYDTIVKESVVTEGLDKNKPYFDFLVALRDSGATNMFGATPYLQDAFDLSKSEARKILAEWMKSFNEAKTNEATVVMDAMDPGSRILTKLLKKHKVTMEIIDNEGPSGWPEVELTGDRKDLEKVLASEDGWDDADLAEYIEESNGTATVKVKAITEAKSNIAKKWDSTNTMMDDLREFINDAKDAGGEDLVKDIHDALRLMTNYAKGELKESVVTEANGQTVKEFGDLLALLLDEDSGMDIERAIIAMGPKDARVLEKQISTLYKKLFDLTNQGFDLREDILVTNEAFSRMSSDVIGNELYTASQALTTYYDWLKAGNDSGKGKSLDHIISLLKKCKSSIKRFNDKEETIGTEYEASAFESVVIESKMDKEFKAMYAAIEKHDLLMKIANDLFPKIAKEQEDGVFVNFKPLSQEQRDEVYTELVRRLKLEESIVTEKFSFSKKEVEAAANLIASAISQADKVKAKVHDLEYDKGRGAGFEISIDGEKYDGGSYVVKDNGDVVNAAIGNSHPNAVYNTIGNKDIADVFVNMEKYESVTEAKEEPIVALLKLGLFAAKGTGEKKLLRLSDDFEEIGDEQADEIASHLNMAIELFQDGYSKDAVSHFKKFNKACKDELALMKKQGLAESVVTEGKKFKPGDKWSNNFDYDGMLAYALKVNHKTPLKTLQKLHDSATDVNYHTPFAGLGNAIDWITDDGVNSKEGKDFIKQFHKDIKDELKESVVTEGKDDYVARYQGTNINLKKAYKHLDDEALNQVYLEIGELIADNKLKVKDATFTFEAEETPSWGNLINNINHKLNEDLRRDLKKYIDKNEDEINKLADEDAFETIYNNLRAEFDIVEGTKEDKDMIETFQFVF